MGPLLHDERSCQKQRPSAAHRQIVYSAQPSDVAARKEQWRDNERVRRKRNARSSYIEHRLVI
jgi:hypothetical protein